LSTPSFGNVGRARIPRLASSGCCAVILRTCLWVYVYALTCRLVFLVISAFHVRFTSVTVDLFSKPPDPSPDALFYAVSLKVFPLPPLTAPGSGPLSSTTGRVLPLFFRYWILPELSLHQIFATSSLRFSATDSLL